MFYYYWYGTFQITKQYSTRVICNMVACFLKIKRLLLLYAIDIHERELFRFFHNTSLISIYSKTIFVA